MVCLIGNRDSMPLVRGSIICWGYEQNGVVHQNQCEHINECINDMIKEEHQKRYLRKAKALKSRIERISKLNESR